MTDYAWRPNDWVLVAPRVLRISPARALAHEERRLANLRRLEAEKAAAMPVDPGSDVVTVRIRWPWDPYLIMRIAGERG